MCFHFSLQLVHQYEFSTKICLVKVHGLVTLSGDLYHKACGFVVITWEPLIKLWRFPQYFTVSMTALKD
jgi:hypothetical protein